MNVLNKQESFNDDFPEGLHEGISENFEKWNFFNAHRNEIGHTIERNVILKFLYDK